MRPLQPPRAVSGEPERRRALSGARRRPDRGDPDSAAWRQRLVREPAGGLGPFGDEICGVVGEGGGDGDLVAASVHGQAGACGPVALVVERTSPRAGDPQRSGAGTRPRRPLGDLHGPGLRCVRGALAGGDERLVCFALQSGWGLHRRREPRVRAGQPVGGLGQRPRRGGLAPDPDVRRSPGAWGVRRCARRSIPTRPGPRALRPRTPPPARPRRWESPPATRSTTTWSTTRAAARGPRRCSRSSRRGPPSCTRSDTSPASTAARRRASRTWSTRSAPTWSSPTKSGSPTGTGKRTTDDPYVPAGYWSDQQRLHQYEGGHNETYGGVTINIDGDYADGATADTGGGDRRRFLPLQLPSNASFRELRGLRIAQARSKLRRTHCTLGRVNRPRHRVHHRVLRITRQHPDAGKRLRRPRAGEREGEVA